MEAQLKLWIKEFYRGCNLHGKCELKAFNDTYSLIHIDGYTGYIGRISGSSYSQQEWFVCKNLAGNSRNSSLGTIPDMLFHTEGRLTKEHKILLKGQFNLEYIPNPNKAEKFDGEWLVYFDNDVFWSTGFNACVYCHKILTRKNNVYTVLSKTSDAKITVNPNKNYCKIVSNSDKDDVLKELKILVDKFKAITEIYNKQKRDILEYIQN